MAKSFIMFSIIFSLLLGFLANISGNGQQPEKKPEQEEVLRLKTELLEIRAVVTNKQNRLIEGLKKEDFELLESSRPQDIAFFSEQHIKSAGKNHSSPLPIPSGSEKSRSEERRV